MSRVDASEVKEIIETSMSDSAIEAYITAANLTVTKYLDDEDLDDAQLKEIERWLTAHLIASTKERSISKENTMQAGASYDGKTGMGLDATLYGQQVKILDTTGTLASLEKNVGLKTASIYSITSFD